jgi:NAD(P)-dependent dehydrogenase (short-subunit alcohol dehydrogenase family)
VTQDGQEMTFGLNHLNYFLLTNLLLDWLNKSTSARVVSVSSGAHKGARIDFDDLQMEHSYTGFGAYGRSKLANILFTYELARRLAGQPITVNTLHPGFVATNFGGNNPGLIRLALKLTQLLALSPQKGAETSIYLASSTEVEGITGKYFDRKQAVPSSPESYDQETARRLWEISAQLTGLN